MRSLVFVAPPPPAYNHPSHDLLKRVTIVRKQARIFGLIRLQGSGKTGKRRSYSSSNTKSKSRGLLRAQWPWRWAKQSTSCSTCVKLAILSRSCDASIISLFRMVLPAPSTSHIHVVPCLGPSHMSTYRWCFMDSPRDLPPFLYLYRARASLQSSSPCSSIHLHARAMGMSPSKLPKEACDARKTDVKEARARLLATSADARSHSSFPLVCPSNGCSQCCRCGERSGGHWKQPAHRLGLADSDSPGMHPPRASLLRAEMFASSCAANQRARPRPPPCFVACALHEHVTAPLVVFPGLGRSAGTRRNGPAALS